MNHDCIYYDECETASLSCCCCAPIICGDICSDCKEHTDDSCEECPDYKTNEFDGLFETLGDAMNPQNARI